MGLESLFAEDVSADLRLTKPGKTHMILAARDCHMRIVWYLVDKGADIKLQDDEGRTALIDLGVVLIISTIYIDNKFVLQMVKSDTPYGLRTRH